MRGAVRGYLGHMCMLAFLAGANLHGAIVFFAADRWGALLMAGAAVYCGAVAWLRIKIAADRVVALEVVAAESAP